ncbi:glycosyltransferase [uncultured Clostridium sp.]|uniref:glycosyltransferase n=1 Tax=uncultured Clostridium sp. TaxID=59620 RepID=UPI00259496EF|nr:glycosyltransferase [uncultured Clostridium sp.]
MKKKLLFVIDSLHSGGAEKSLVSLLSLIDYNNFDVDLLLFKQSGLYLPLIPKQVNILDTPSYFNNSNKEFKNRVAKIKNSILIRIPNYKNKYHGAQITAKNILKALDRQSTKYDVAIAYSQGFPTYYVSDKVEATKKICWINTDYKKAGYNPKFDRKYYEKYDYMVSVSKKNKEVLEKVYPEFKYKIRVIYDIISTQLVREMAENGEGFSDNFEGIRILTIGRHVYLKGYDMAIDAAKILKDNRVTFRWYSIGEGTLTDELKNKIKEYDLEDKFIFLGTFTNPYPFIKECDIYCQPSRFEGFGLAIAEARILNKPIVVTNFDIVYDQIKDEENGLISEMNGYSVSKNIERLIEEENLRKKIINNIKMEQVGTEDEINKVLKLLE